MGELGIKMEIDIGSLTATFISGDRSWGVTAHYIVVVPASVFWEQLRIFAAGGRDLGSWEIKDPS